MANGRSLDELEAAHKSKEDARNEQRQARQERLSQPSSQTDDEKMDALAARLTSPEQPKPKAKAKARAKKEEKTEEPSE